MTEFRRKAILELFDAETDLRFRDITDISIQLPSPGIVGSYLEPVVPKEAVKSVLEERRRQDRLALESRYQPKVTMVDGDDTTTGASAAVFAELDKRTVRSLTFVVGDSYENEHVIIELSREGIRSSGYSGMMSSAYGVTLKVASTDRGWAKQVFAQLSEEVDKGVPKYSWVHKRLGRLVVGVGSVIAVTFAIILMILPAIPHGDRWIAWVGSAYSMLFGSTAIVSTTWFFNWLAPPFEVIGEDGQTSGWRRVSALLGIAGTVILGIIVNRIS